MRTSAINQGKKKVVNIDEHSSLKSTLYAQFDTANYLIVINRINEPKIKLSDAIYYDLKYDSKMLKREIDIKITARIINTDGKIVWIKDINKNLSDFVLPQFIDTLKKSETSKDSSSFNFFKNILH